MREHLLFLIVGLGAGAIYAALAMGLVATYRGTGVINVAQGAMAMWGAYVYAQIRETGELILPIGGVDVGGPAGPAWAFVAGAGSAALLGLLVHLLVFRPLRSAPALARVVASVGVMLTLQALVVLRFGTEVRVLAPLLPDGQMTVAGLTFSQDRLYLGGAAVVIAALLWGYARFTRLGLATRAAAENERAAALTGYSPDRMAGVTWVLSSLLAGCIVILAAPSTGLNAADYSLFVVPALACALLGRLTSVWIACGAGLALGAFQSEITFLSTATWWPDWATVGVADAVPFVVVVVALFVFGRRIPARDAATVDALPEVVRPRLRPGVVTALVAAGIAALVLTEGSFRFGVITSMIVAIIALSLVLLTGLVGQISLAQAAIAGTAGFALSKVGTGLPFPLSLVVAGLVAAAIGVAVGIPALRIRGAQLAVVTLAAAVAVEQFVFRNQSFSPPTGNPIPDPGLAGLDLAVRRGEELARLEFGLLVLAVLVACALGVANLARSATGRAFLAVRSNERAAAAAGIDVARTKLMAFALSSFVAGLGGALIGYSRGQLSADSFGVFVGLSFLAFAYLGGITSVGGALVAGAFAPLGIGYVVLDRSFGLAEEYLLLSGLALIVTAVLNPGGIAGRTREIVAAAGRRRTRNPNPVPVEAGAPTLEVAGRV